MRSALQAKCLCLAILSGIVGTASGADVDATSNNRVGVSEEDIAIHAYEPGSLKLEPQRGDTIPDYDPEGNRTDRVAGSATRTYDYDRENRLLSVTEGTGQWRYDYDYRTRRVIREENGQPERISFSGGTSVQEYSAASSLHTPTVEYVRGSDMGGGIGGILYSVRGDTASFAHYNARGDVVAKSGSTGALTWQARYEGFGARTSELGTNPDKQRANTREEEPWGGLYENMRWRDLETGQYFTRDPAGFVDGPNLYAYVRQNPWTHFDPLGLAEERNYTPAQRRMKAQMAQDFKDYGGWKQVGSTASDFVPFAGAGKGAYETIKGTDPITGKPLSTGERVVAGIGTVASVLPGGKAAVKGIGKAIMKGGDEAATTVTATARTTQEATEQALEEGFEVSDGVKRAKQAELRGESEIKGVMNVDEETVMAVDVPLITLTSPMKSKIELTDPKVKKQWDRIEEGASDPDVELPPITVNPGNRGPLIEDVEVIE